MPDITRSADLLAALAGHARAAMRFAVKDLTDDEWRWQPGPAEVMTIGWRFAHVVAVLESYTATTFEGRRVPFAEVVQPVDAAAAAARLFPAQDAFMQHVGAVANNDLERMTPAHWGEELPLWQLIWTVVVEQFHHGAEIGALRDVKRGRPRDDAWPELQNPQWWPADLTD